MRRIISFHDFNGTPNRARLDEIARAAQALGADIFKIGTRTDTTGQLRRLLDFHFLQKQRRMKIAVMGFGRLGRISRREFAHHRSALNYGHLGKPQAEGQFSVTQLRRLLR
jgi:3-dehydroquinate dehydratase-1